MCIRIATALMFTVCSFFYGNAVSQDLHPIDIALLMAKIDYSKAHAALLDTCKAKHPESTDGLTKSISKWEAENKEAQIELQKIVRKSSKLTSQASDREFQQTTDDFMKSFESMLVNTPSGELRKLCEGKYANVTLKSPALDFASVLKKIQAPIDPSDNGEIKPGDKRLISKVQICLPDKRVYFDDIELGTL